MSSNEHDEALIDLYARKDESTRLARREGRVELLRTRALLRQRLEPAQRILDVGGADGVHASWLAASAHLLAFGRRGSARPPQPGVVDPPTS